MLKLYINQQKEMETHIIDEVLTANEFAFNLQLKLQRENGLQ